MKNILIIGATSGIGHQLYEHYTNQGHKVCVIGRRLDILVNMANEHPSLTTAKCCDIADTSKFDTTFTEIVQAMEHIDLAIICAGIGELNPTLSYDTESAVIATNITGWTNAITSIYHQFEQQGYGHLVTITSIGGLQPSATAPSYSASKAFQINYTKSLQSKSRNTGIAVTEIRPGLINTRMAKGDNLFWVMPLDKAVSQTANAIRKKKRRAVITHRWRLINFLLKHI